MRALFSGTKLREARLDASMTQQVAADKMAITTRTLYSWESGVSVPNATQVYICSRLFRQDMNEFFIQWPTVDRMPEVV